MSLKKLEKKLPVDSLLLDIAEYVVTGRIDSSLAYETARLCLLDSLGCALLALQHPACVRLLGPVVKGAHMENGTPIPGMSHRLDPVQAAFNIGSMIRWLDYNDTWLAAEWGHPSDNFGGILASADYESRRRAGSGRNYRMVDVLTAAIKAYEIQGVLALDNSFNRVGLDHVLLVRVATAAVSAHLLGGGVKEVVDALSQAWIDGGALRTYRHAPNTGSRKSWAAGDATSRGVRLALLTLEGEMGYPTVLSTPTWGFQDVLFSSKPLKRTRPFASYVVENILFKVSYPAEFHAQTAVEAAVSLHPKVAPRLGQIERITIETQEAAVRIIDKTGPLNNYADRDHCLQYMTAVGLIYGDLTAENYEDERAADPRIDSMRDKMDVVENERYSADYLDPGKRSIANAVQVFFHDGSNTEKVEVLYPIGHPRRRDEALPLIRRKFESNLATCFSSDRADAILEVFSNRGQLEEMRVDEFMELFAV